MSEPEKLRIRVRVSTRKVGSECEDFMEFDADELPDHPAERQDYIEEAAMELAFAFVDWDWEVVPS